MTNENIVEVTIRSTVDSEYLTFSADPDTNEISIYGNCLDGFIFDASELNTLGTLLATGLNL